MYPLRVSFRAKLDRLETPALRDAAVDPGPKQPVLDELRARIAAIFERTAVAARPPPPVDTVDLPFATVDTTNGPLHTRTLLLGPAHRVGHASTHVAKGAERTILALLALDPSLAQTDFARALYLDTETTGLSGGTGTVPFLVGLAWFGERGLVLEQLLVRRLGEEAPMLARVRERIAACDVLVTFNGKAFDMPLLRTRFVMNRIEPAPHRAHLDLLHVARRVHRARKTACKLTELERRVLGFVREGDIPGSDISAVYLHFLRTHDARALLGVIEHNALDVASMAALVGLYGEPLTASRLRGDDLAGVARTLHRAGSEEAMSVAELAVESGGGPDSVRARADIAKARGERDRALRDYASLEDDEAHGHHVRLELAKLFEHHLKNPTRALEVLGKGVREKEPQLRKRKARLERKVARVLSKVKNG